MTHAELDPLTVLAARAGQYEGEGVNHEGQPFRGRLTLEPALSGKGMKLAFLATDLAGRTAFHAEDSLIGLTEAGVPGLWVLSTNHTSIHERTLRADGPSVGAERTLTFGVGDPTDRRQFREEVSLDLWADGDVTYRYAWGLADGDFLERSAVRMVLAAQRPAAQRPALIKHYTEVQLPDTARYPGNDELLSIGSPFARAMGLTRLGIHHELLPPGRRTSFPHAEQDEEEFIYVVAGHPHVWLDGEVHQLSPGDGVAFPCGTGLSHTFLNDTEQDVRLLVVGEASKKASKIFYPLNPERQPQVDGNWWHDVPPRVLGSHDGRPAARTKAPGPK